MKQAFAAILAQQMDKQTSEQFWAVAAATGMNAFILAQGNAFVALLHTSVVIATVELVNFYAIYFIIDRHVSYYRYFGELVLLSRGEPDRPAFLTECPPTWQNRSLVGVIFYLLWVVILAVGTPAILILIF